MKAKTIARMMQLNDLHHAALQNMHLRKRVAKAWLNTKIDNLLVSFFRWAFNKHAVQEAIAEAINCRTPIGRMLNEHIDDVTGRIDAGDIMGIESLISNEIEEAMRNIKVDAEDVDDLDDAVMEVIQNREVLAAIVDEICERLTRRR